MMAYVTVHAPTKHELDACIRCGLCLPACPTYRLTGLEAASPRGRLQAMSLVLEGVAPIDAAFDEVISFCLGCRACEAVCPGLVPYGRVLEGARAELTEVRPGRLRPARRVVLGGWIDRPWLMRAVTKVAWALQRVRGDRLLPAALGRALRGLRQLPRPLPTVRGTVTPPAARPGRGRVGLLAGCVMEPWFSQVHEATIALLSAAGFEVVVPAAQGCCGALAAHDGHAAAAARMAEVNRVAFGGCDIVVSNAAGCSAHLKDLRFDPTGFEILDVTELVARCLSDGSLPRLEGPRGEVALQDPCHLRHAQRVTELPRAILRAAGYEPLEIDPDGLCCGAAGIYSLLRPEAAHQLGTQKADQVLGSAAMIVASANPGCEMQLRSHLPSSIRVAHPVELYWEAFLAERAVR